MAIIVDKEQKRRDIAFASKELFLKESIKDITVSKIAKSANVSKGSIYDYFKNKEEILFELIYLMMANHDEKKRERLNNLKTTKEKIKSFGSFFYEKDDEELRIIYKKFLSINLLENNKKMKEFQTECFEKYRKWMEEIVEEGIKNKELKKDSKKYIKPLFVMAEGLYISSVTTFSTKDLEKELNGYIDMVFECMEVKK